MIARNLTLAEINELAICILYEKLGVAHTLQFLGQYRKGSGDYTRDRDSLFPQKSVDELYAEVKAWQDRNLTNHGQTPAADSNDRRWRLRGLVRNQ